MLVCKCRPFLLNKCDNFISLLEISIKNERCAGMYEIRPEIEVERYNLHWPTKRWECAYQKIKLRVCRIKRTGQETRVCISKNEAESMLNIKKYKTTCNARLCRIRHRQNLVYSTLTYNQLLLVFQALLTTVHNKDTITYQTTIPWTNNIVE